MDPAPGRDTREDLSDHIARLAGQFDVDSATIARVASLFDDVRTRAPDLYVPVASVISAALTKVAAAPADISPVYAALGEWALDGEGETMERMRRECLRCQSAMTRGVLRLYGADTERSAASIAALENFIYLQTALLASLAARKRAAGGVMRTLPTPEYAAFMEILRTTIESHRQEGKELGLLLLQISKVEQVDRLLGLQRGEAFMLRATRRLREGVLRKQDQLGRVSRDQFACLLPRIAGEGVAILAANKILSALESPVPIGDRSFAPDAVIGIAMFPAHGADPQKLVRNGKLAVRAARAAGERLAVYVPEHGENEERIVQHEARLRRALEENALELLFEPQVDMSSGRVAGLECMLYWNDVQLGEVSESRAVEAAETSGLIREVTWWIFNNALRLTADFAQSGIDVPISLKVTASVLAQPDFVEFVERALSTWKVPPDRLVIEIQEIALVGGIDKLHDVLGRLKGLGLRLGIDGFGTGSSSLSNLAQLPLDEVKLGAAFVGDMLQSPIHAKIVRSLAHLAQDLGLRVTAEGVNDAETALALSTIGCERLQGAHVARPLNAMEVLALNAGDGSPSAGAVQ
jgi:diguanylate cyclase